MHIAVEDLSDWIQRLYDVLFCRFTCTLQVVLLRSMLTTNSDVASPKIWGRGKMFDFRRIILFCLAKRLSKRKMTIYSKNLGNGPWPLWPPLAPPVTTKPTLFYLFVPSLPNKCYTFEVSSTGVRCILTVINLSSLMQMSAENPASKLVIGPSVTLRP